MLSRYGFEFDKRDNNEWVGNYGSTMIGAESIFNMGPNLVFSGLIFTADTQLAVGDGYFLLSSSSYNLETSYTLQVYLNNTIPTRRDSRWLAFSLW